MRNTRFIAHIDPMFLFNICHIFLCHIEDLIFSTCPDSYKPKFYRRYLDDTFAVFDSETQATNFFQFINSIHKNLSFTIEKQVDRKLKTPIFRFICGQ